MLLLLNSGWQLNTMGEYMTNIKRPDSKAFNSSILLFSSYRKENENHSETGGKK
jgi:hypothetical protein